MRAVAHVTAAAGPEQLSETGEGFWRFYTKIFRDKKLNILAFQFKCTTTACDAKVI